MLALDFDVWTNIKTFISRGARATLHEVPHTYCLQNLVDSLNLIPKYTTLS